MNRAGKITISLPSELLQVIERERRARKQTRSQFFRHAVESFMRRQQELTAVERYVRGYREQPETDEEVLAAHHAACEVLAAEPWE